MPRVLPVDERLVGQLRHGGSNLQRIACLGAYEIDDSQKHKRVVKVVGIGTDAVGYRFQNPDNLATLGGLEFADGIVQLNNRRRFHVACLARGRLVVNDSRNAPFLRCRDRNHKPSIADSESSVSLNPTFLLRLGNNAADEFRCRALLFSLLAADACQFGRSVVADAALLGHNVLNAVRHKRVNGNIGRQSAQGGIPLGVLFLCKES